MQRLPSTSSVLRLSWRSVSSTKTMTGFFLGRARITLLASFSQDSAMSMSGLNMKRRIRVSNVSGISKNVRPRAMALRAREFALAMRKLKAARTATRGLAEVREHAFDLACLVVQWHRLAHGRLLLCGFVFTTRMERFRPRVNLFLYAYGKV